ncbi:mobilization protein, partial [Campylobacter coli]|nr:mobilization protein [Campylobacter coli]
KNDKSIDQEQKNDLRAISDTQNDNNTEDKKMFFEKLATYRLNEVLSKIYSKPLKRIVEPETEAKKKERIKILTETMEKTEIYLPETFKKWLENNKDIDLKEILVAYQNSLSKELKQSKSIYKGR